MKVCVFLALSHLTLPRAVMVDEPTTEKEGSAHTRHSVDCVESTNVKLYGDDAYRQRYDAMVGQPAPNLHIEDWLNSEALDWSRLHGRVVLLDFWGVWCVPCQKSTRPLIRLHELYANRGLVIISVHTTRGGENMARYVRKKKIPYIVGNDVDDDTVTAYKVTSYPAVHVVDHRGILRYADVDILDDGIMRGSVETAIRILLCERESDLGKLGAPGTDRHFAEDMLPKLQKIEKEGFAGYVHVNQQGVPLIDEGFGLADREARQPWSRRTVSTIGSITKQFTAAAILKLQEAGKLNVKDPIARYLPEVPSGRRGITIHHLLTHTSGLTDIDGLDDWDPITAEAFVRRLFAAEPSGRPGERWNYSNAGYSLLGIIIEKVSGQSYEAFLRESLLLPAGLANTGYVLAQFDRSHLAQGYRSGERWGTVLDRPMAVDGPHWGLRANGGIHSNAADMVKWAYALLDAKVLSAKSVHALWTPWAHEREDSPYWYGYGWSLLTLPTGERVAFHNGGNGVHYAEFAIAPVSRAVLFMQTNVAADEPVTRDIIRKLGDRLLVGPDAFD